MKNLAEKNLAHNIWPSGRNKPIVLANLVEDHLLVI